MATKLKVLQPEVIETPPPAPEPTMAELHAAITDRGEQLQDALDSLRFKIAYTRGDELTALLDEEVRLVSEIDREPFRYAISRGQWAVAQAMQNLKDIEAQYRRADDLSKRRDEVQQAASKIADADEREIETQKARMFDTRAHEARNTAVSGERNNVLHEPKRNYERRIAELRGKLELQQKKLAEAKRNPSYPLIDAQTGMNATGIEHVERLEPDIERIEVEIAEAEAAIKTEEAKQVSISNPQSWPDSIRNDCFQSANSCRERIYRRAQRIRGKF